MNPCLDRQIVNTDYEKVHDAYQTERFRETEGRGNFTAANDVPEKFAVNRNALKHRFYDAKTMNEVR